MVKIQVAVEATDKLVESYERLIPQLSTTSNPPSKNELAQIINSETATILFAEDDNGLIVGTMTLILFRIPTGIRAWIEDVVVDSGSRGQGIGKKLNQFALELAEKSGAKTVDLTSRPARESANSLYQQLGFTIRETNVYRLTFNETSE